MYYAPILAPEDGVEQPKEYAVGQPIDASDSYPKIYGVPVNTDVEDPNAKYWIECVQGESCGDKGLYNIHKGLYPNSEKKIMTCSKETVNGLCTTGDELVFKRKGITQAELRYVRMQLLTGRCTYSLRNQQGELGLVYVYNDDNDKIDYYPFFQLVRIDSRLSTSIITLIFLCLLGVGLYLAVTYGQIAMIISAIVLLLLFILCCYSCLSPSCQEDGVNRLHTSDVKDITNHQLVAKVYSLRGTCGSHSNDIEIICRRAVTTAQLMGLISLAILSASKRKRDERNRSSR